MRTKVLNQIESPNLVKGETNTLFEASCDRTDIATGGFYDNWDDGGATDNNNNSPTPYKLHSYKLRVFTTKPCVIYSAVAENLRVAKLSPSGVDTAFSQRSMSNGIIKKWSQTTNGGYWSFLEARPRGRNGKGPQILNDATWKLQIKNVDPEILPEDACKYYAIIECEISYDATNAA